MAGKLLPDQINDLILKDRSGVPVLDLAREFGVSRKTIRNYLNRAGIPLRDGYRTGPERKHFDDIVSAHSLGEAVGDIAIRLGVRIGTVRDNLKLIGVSFPRKKIHIMPDVVAERYRAGESTMEIAISLGVSEAWVAATIKSAGQPFRSKLESARLRASKGASTRRLALDTSSIDASHRGGESIKVIAEEIGCSRAAIIDALNRDGFTVRGRSEAMIIRMSQASFDERSALTAAAHVAARGRVRSDAEKHSSAKTRQNRGLHTSPAEIALIAKLQALGIECISQQAIGPYNCDIGANPVAVEVFGGHWHWHGHHMLRTPERFRYILDAGWHIIAIMINAAHPLTSATADYVAAFYQEACRNPTGRREYRVIRGAGELMASGSADDDEISIIPTFKAGRDSTNGRYKRVPR